MSKSDRWHSSPTQVYWCCKALIEGRSISHRTEIREVRGWRLAAIAHTLKHRYGWPIVVEFRGPENTAYYSLPADTDIGALRLPASAKCLAEMVVRND